VPFLAPLTILIFVFAGATAIFRFFGFILLFPVQFSLSYVIGVIDWFSVVPFASFQVKNLSWLWLLPVYAVLIWLAKAEREKQRLKFLDY